MKSPAYENRIQLSVRRRGLDRLLGREAATDQNSFRYEAGGEFEVRLLFQDFCKQYSRIRDKFHGKVRVLGMHARCTLGLEDERPGRFTSAHSLYRAQ
jgi:hypothetical protein